MKREDAVRCGGNCSRCRRTGFQLGRIELTGWEGGGSVSGAS